MVAPGSSAAASPASRPGCTSSVAHPDPRPWLHAADVLAMPSAYESYGLVVLEALACGVPVVATPTGCVPDVVVDGINGPSSPRRRARSRAASTAVLAADRRGRSRGRHGPRPRSTPGREVAQRYLDLLTMCGLDPGIGSTVAGAP